MKHIMRNGNLWSIAETESDKAKLTEAIKFLEVNDIGHSAIYSGPPGQENPIIEELTIVR